MKQDLGCGCADLGTSWRRAGRRSPPEAKRRRAEHDVIAADPGWRERVPQDVGVWTAKLEQIGAVEVHMGAGTARAVRDCTRDGLHGCLGSILEVGLVQAAATVGVAGCYLERMSISLNFDKRV